MSFLQTNLRAGESSAIFASRHLFGQLKWCLEIETSFLSAMMGLKSEVTHSVLRYLELHGNSHINLKSVRDEVSAYVFPPRALGR